MENNELDHKSSEDEDEKDDDGEEIERERLIIAEKFILAMRQNMNDSLYMPPPEDLIKKSAIENE